MQQFKDDPFGTLDELDVHVYGFQLNILRSDQKLCKALLQIFCVIPLVLWVLLGADSTADQVVYFLLNTPNVVLGKLTFTQWIDVYWSYYGLGTHWSAAVIYSLLLIGISHHLRNHLEIVNSENLCLTTGVVGLTIATFEFFWMSSYYVFQGQHWILSLQWPQLRIILQNLMFLTPGLIVLCGLDYSKYQLNVNKRTWLILGATIGLVLVWWYYPFQTETLSVPVEGASLWQCRQQFPQTMYTIDVNVTDNVAIGDMFHIEDAGVHLTNNVTKIVMTLFFYNLFLLQRRSKNETHI